ncbi:MAG: hypothetical protein NC827_00535 [Candidatus Omnitrophica bacterium]|nr:hypothetical protein [Candidatus Omnitrophota bacterium]MCM8801789.1 hypothetical protein [Candidatus Omnitrophota bacterium]
MKKMQIEIIKWIKKKNEIIKIIKPNYKKKINLKYSMFINYLLKNCKKCIEDSCLAFSVKLVNEEKIYLTVKKFSFQNTMKKENYYLIC